MRDKTSNGQVDPDRDHHMINGRLVPVTEPTRKSAGKKPVQKRRQAAKKGKDVGGTTVAHA